MSSLQKNQRVSSKVKTSILTLLDSCNASNSSRNSLNFNELKELPYFKNYLKQYDIGTLKEIIPIVVQCFYDQEFDHENSVYVSNLPAKKYEAGYAIPSNLCMEDFSASAKIYQLSKQTELILKKVYFLDLPTIKDLKAVQKFWFYFSCHILKFQFNKPIAKFADMKYGVYFVLDGEVKKIQKIALEQKKYYNYETLLEQGTIFGKCQNLLETIQPYELVSSSNLTKILFIPEEHLQKYCYIDAISIILKETLIQADKQQVIVPPRPPLASTMSQTASIMSMKSSMFLKKCDKFLKNQNIVLKNSAFENYIRSKNLLIRLNQCQKIHSSKSCSKRDLFQAKKGLEKLKIEKILRSSSRKRCDLSDILAAKIRARLNF